MTPEQTKAAIAVMQAYVDKKPINVLRKLTGESIITMRAGGSSTPNWDWSRFDFVIAPEPKYRPYNSPAEVPIGSKVRCKHSGSVHMIWESDRWDTEPAGAVKVDIVNLYGGGSVGAGIFFYDYEFLDGKPCGILEGQQ